MDHRICNFYIYWNLTHNKNRVWYIVIIQTTTKLSDQIFALHLVTVDFIKIKTSDNTSSSFFKRRCSIIWYLFTKQLHYLKFRSLSTQHRRTRIRSESFHPFKCLTIRLYVEAYIRYNCSVFDNNIDTDESYWFSRNICQYICITFSLHITIFCHYQCTLEFLIWLTMSLL